MNKITFLLSLVSLLGFAGCTDTELEPNKDELGIGYFPLDIGVFVDYEVKQTSYFPNDPTIDEQFQMREVLTETYTNIEGKTAYKIQRYKRPDGNVPWRLDSVYAAHIDGFNAFRLMNNRYFIKLAFPLAVGKKWNGNAFNEFKKDDNTIVDLGVPRKINNFTFDKTLKVELSNDSNLVYQDKRFEIYAEKVGLIQLETKIVNYCTANTTCITQRKVISGTIRTQTLLNYGKLF
jgi:hypothetical protein